MAEFFTPIIENETLVEFTASLFAGAYKRKQFYIDITSETKQHIENKRRAKMKIKCMPSTPITEAEMEAQCRKRNIGEEINKLWWNSIRDFLNENDI